MISDHPWLFALLLIGCITGFTAIATIAAIMAIGRIAARNHKAEGDGQ